MGGRFLVDGRFQPQPEPLFQPQARWLDKLLSCHDRAKCSHLILVYAMHRPYGYLHMLSPGYFRQVKLPDSKIENMHTPISLLAGSLESAHWLENFPIVKV
jgi:hypothetical protein